ncbi:hypothetical protein EV361DRAFT_771498, partial [Lentinula raphanica]
LAHSVVTAQWVAKSVHPFLIVQDRGYQWLQKEGRPNYFVSSDVTVARDAKKLYVASKQQLVQELDTYEYFVLIELDCWSSPNHHAFMSIIAKMMQRGKEGSEELTSVMLDFMELPCSHSGENM